MNPANFSTGIVTYAWRCHFCDASEQASRLFNAGDAVWIPKVPEGWRQIPDDYFPVFACPKHSVALLVDGKPV